MADIIDISSSPTMRPIRLSGQMSVIDITDSEPDEEVLLLPSGTKTTAGSSSTRTNDFSQYLAQVLEIVPDVDPEHALALLKSHHESRGSNAVEPVLHALFEDNSYPKVNKDKGKRKREEDEANERAKSRKIDYGDKNRAPPKGPNYRTLAIQQLYLDFPYIPVTHLRQQLALHNDLYAPTNIFFTAQLQEGKLSYKPKATPSKVVDKGKGKELTDDLFQAERQWILNRSQEDIASNDAKVAEKVNEKEYEDCGDGIECGCCFTAYPFDKMVQCPDAHLFCTECMISYSENLLGAHDPRIICMDQSGCKLPFPYSELRRFLTPKLLDLYERVKQRKDIEMAGLENLEECPHCEFKIVIENQEERLFRCQNTECEAVTCRKCKKSDHLPKSCEEMEQDKKLDARHVIEEAMTRALMRNCPKCQKSFVKEMGCNKMTCPGCHTLSCYMCRQVITGYDHFQGGPPGQSNTGKCVLHDSTTGIEQLHNKEVAAAAQKALEDFKRDHPDMDDKELKIDIPKAGPSKVPAPARLGPGGQFVPVPLPRYVNANNHDPMVQQWLARQVGGHGILLPPPAVQYNFNLNFGGVGYPMPVPPVPAIPVPVPPEPQPLPRARARALRVPRAPAKRRR